MLHLLVDTSIFVSLPNGCLCQMTGEPFIIPPGDVQNAITKSTEKYLKRTLSIENNEELPSKRRKLESGKTRRDTYKIKTWAEIRVLRSFALTSRQHSQAFSHLDSPGENALCASQLHSEIKYISHRLTVTAWVYLDQTSVESDYWLEVWTRCSQYRQPRWFYVSWTLGKAPCLGCQRLFSESQAHLTIYFPSTAWPE